MELLPTNEAQCRPLTKLEPAQQQEAWRAVESAGGKVPSGRIIKDIVQRIKERVRLPNPYQGEITIRLDNLRLIDYSTADCEAMAQLRDRLYSLYSEDLEEVARCNLDFLGKLDRPYLTPLEEKLLAVLEA